MVAGEVAQQLPKLRSSQLLITPAPGDWIPLASVEPVHTHTISIIKINIMKTVFTLKWCFQDQITLMYPYFKYV